MGYVFDFQDTVAYEQWFQDDRNQAVLALQNRLMLELIHPVRGQRVLDIGCGAGASLVPFLDLGIQLTGIDPSPYMLDAAREKFKHRADFHWGHAEELPFDDNAFHWAVMCMSLEFCDDPKKALEEACRVAKDGIFVGIINKYALKSARRRMRGIFTRQIDRQARFFSTREIRRMFFNALGEVPMECRTICPLPGFFPGAAIRLEDSRIMRGIPFGAFAGLVAIPVPRFRTTPLTLKPRANRIVPSESGVASCAEK
jgi:SAM-dependent methyltransferase